MTTSDGAGKDKDKGNDILSLPSLGVCEKRKAVLYNVETEESVYIDLPVIVSIIKHVDRFHSSASGTYYYHGVQEGVAFYSTWDGKEGPKHR